MQVDDVKFGQIRKEGGCMNYSKPLLLDNGRKVAVACGLDIRILNVSDNCHVSTLNMHTAKVVGMSLDPSTTDQVLSCDEEGVIFIWKLSLGGVECQGLGKFPIPHNGAVEHVAHVGQYGEVALVVLMDKDTGPRELLLQRHRSQYMKEKYNVLVSNIVAGTNTFSFSAIQSFCAVLTNKRGRLSCNIVPIFINGKNKMNKHIKNRRLLSGRRRLTCVTVHPQYAAVALGDHHGGVEVYYDVLDERPSGSRRLTWHHMPVNDLIFSHTGTELYSGGHEGVLLQWHLAQGAKFEKAFLPRLGQPITHLALSSDSSSMVASHSDNSFSLIDLFELKLVSVLLGQGMNNSNSTVATTTAITSTDNSNNTVVTMATNTDSRSRVGKAPLLAYDERTEAVITKAKPGYFHFYHTVTQQQLFLLDVVHENFVSDASGYRDVLHMSLSSNGRDLVTVDAITGGGTTAPHSQQLKFFTFVESKQRWRLETCAIEPHFGVVGGCLFQPQQSGLQSGAGDKDQEEVDLPVCLTWSLDGEVKIWGATIVKGASQWTTLHCSRYRWWCGDGGADGATAGRDAAVVACWAPCGSLLAVACSDQVTVWSPDPLKWRLLLSKADQYAADIVAVCFSPLSSGRPVLVTCSSLAVRAWCLRSRQLLYTAPLYGTTLAADAGTGLMAVATIDGEIILFRGSEGNPLSRIDIGNSPALSLVFCPPTSAEPSLRSVATRLLFYNQQMDLMSVPISLCGTLLPFEIIDGRRSASDQAADTPHSKLSLLIAESKASAAPAASLFSFMSLDTGSYVRPDIITEELGDTTNYQRSSWSKLLTSFAKKLDKTGH